MNILFALYYLTTLFKAQRGCLPNSWPPDVDSQASCRRLFFMLTLMLVQTQEVKIAPQSRNCDTLPALSDDLGELSLSEQRRRDSVETHTSSKKNISRYKRKQRKCSSFSKPLTIRPLTWRWIWMELLKI